MLIPRTCKETLTALEIHHEDVVEFTKADGTLWRLRLLDTGARIVSTTLKTPGEEEPGGMTVFAFHAEVEINDKPRRLEREVGSNRSFYEPWEVDGVHIWLDAVDAIFDFMRETHAPCRLQEDAKKSLPPRRHARFALQDAGKRVCPDPILPWCPLPPDGITIDLCYRGEDCWLGAYDGASAHGGLDINHPRGTLLTTPIAFDTQFLYNSTERGSNNNRWKGIRHWNDGTVWILDTSHMIRLTVPEHRPLDAGTVYAEGAGVYVGYHDHTHFGFTVLDHGELIRLDPWILFWQMYRDLSA